jgi:hypothetical protein
MSSARLNAKRKRAPWPGSASIDARARARIATFASRRYFGDRSCIEARALARIATFASRRYFGDRSCIEARGFLTLRVQTGVLDD